MHYSLVPTIAELDQGEQKTEEGKEVAGFANVLKFNPNHDPKNGQFAETPGGAAPANSFAQIKPVFGKRQRTTIQDVGAALQKQGFGFKPLQPRLQNGEFNTYFRLNDKDGNSIEVDGKGLHKLLHKSEDGFAEVLKYNPYHDEEGKFTTAGNATFVEIGPKYETTHARSRKRLADAKDLAPGMNAHAKKVEPQITADMQAAKGKGELVGLEFAVKGVGSLVRKIFTDAQDDKTTAAAAAKKIGDSVRYTVQLKEDDYANGAIETLKALEAKGYKVYKFKNTWKPGAEYQGLNTNLEAPDGTKIEVQFHTAASWHTKEKENHPLYEKTREPGVPKALKEKLRMKMISNWAAVPVPKNVYDMKWPPENRG